MACSHDYVNLTTSPPPLTNPTIVLPPFPPLPSLDDLKNSEWI